MSPVVSEHPLYVHTVSALEKTAVRDKLMRLVQYFSRFLSYWLYRKGYPKADIVRVKTIQAQMGNGRKLFRLGKFLATFRAFLTTLNKQSSDSFAHVTNLLKHGGMTGFLFLDSITWLNSTGIYKLSPEVGTLLNKLSYQSWLIAILASFAQGAYAYYLADAKERALVQENEKDSSALKRVFIEKKDASSVMFLNALDTLIPGSALGLVHADDGIVGLAGTITSYLGLRAIW